MKARAAVQVADRTIELRTIDVPPIAPGEALLRVEGNGICGTDYEQFEGALAGAGVVEYPVIPGHEPIGTIEQIGAEAAALWGLQPGDRVAVESYVPCHVCSACRLGRTRACQHRFMYGFAPLTLGCGLWGGFAEYMLLRPNTITHRLPLDLSVEDAVLFNPLGAGFAWVREAGTVVGDTLLVLGPGQRGLACVLAAAKMGVGRVIVTGLAKDAAKLELAKVFGAHDVLVADQDDVVSRVRELTGGAMADQVVDTTPFATQSVMQAVRSVRPGGTIVLGGIKGMRTVPDFVSDEIVLGGLTVRGVLAADTWAYQQAIDLITSGSQPLYRLHTHTIPLDAVEHGVRLLAGDVVDGRPALHITITP